MTAPESEERDPAPEHRDPPRGHRGPAPERPEPRAIGRVRVLHVTDSEAPTDASAAAGDARNSAVGPAAWVAALDGSPAVRQAVLDGNGSTTISLARTDFAPDVVHAHGVRALRRAVIGLSLSGDPAPIVASLTDDEAGSNASMALCRRAALLLLGPASLQRMRSAGLEPARLRLLDASRIEEGRLEAVLLECAIAGYRAVVSSERLRRDYRRRLDRWGRLRRALPTPAVDAGVRR